jgi:hypothetical protein
LLRISSFTTGINKNTEIKWDGCRACSSMGEKRNAHSILVEKSEGNRPLGRPGRRWVDNIKMDLREIGWGVMYWVDLAQDRDQCWDLLKMVMKLSDSITFCEIF